MNWFRKIRNDHTQGVAFSAGGLVEKTSTGPRPGTTAVHDIVPLKADLTPRVDNLHNSLMQVARAEEYVAGCERPLVHHPGALQASTDGRCKRFVKSAAHKAGGLVGIGRGEVPMVHKPWDRAGTAQPEPLEVLDGTPKYRQLLHLEPRAQRQARQTVAALASEQVSALHSDSKNEYRRAQDKSAATASRASHAQTVNGWMREHVQLAREKHKENLITSVQDHDKHEKMQLRLRLMGQQLQTWHAMGVQATQQLQQLSDDTALARKKIERLEQDLVKMKDQLHGETTDHHSAQLEDNLVTRFSLLDELTQTHQDLQQSLQTQTSHERDLAQAKHNMRHSVPFSSTWSNAKASVAELREMVVSIKALNVEMQTHLADLNDRLGQTSNVVTRLEKDKKLHTKRMALQADIVQTLARLRTLNDQTNALKRTHETNQVQRHTLQTSYNELSDKAFEFRKIQIIGAQNRAQKSNLHLQELTELQPRQEAATAAMVPARHEAAVRFEQEKTKNQLRLQKTQDNSVQNPPGFSPADLASPQGQALRQHLGVLAARLSAPPVGKTQDQHERGWRMPGEQAMAVVLDTLDLVCCGDVSQAAQVAQGLVERSFASLVPQPGTDFNGNPVQIDEPAGGSSPLEAMLHTMISLPNGLDMLEHVTAPEPHPQAANETLKNAVMVYHKATTTLHQNPPEDAKSTLWLQHAQEAAKRVAHPTLGEAHEQHCTQLTEKALERFNKLSPQAQYYEAALSPKARQAFNGVRNGLTSVAPGSPHHEVNLWLKKLGDMFANADPSSNAPLNTNPLNARRMVVKGAAQVGLPSPENRCSQHLKTVCDELLDLTGVEKNALRERANLGSTSGPHLTESVVRARHLLSYIRDHYNKGKRIDTLMLNARAWKTINKATAHDMATGAKPRERSDTLKSLTQGLTPLGGKDSVGLPLTLFPDPQESATEEEPQESLDSDMAARQARLDSLDSDMAAMQAEPLNAMQALERLHQQFVINPTLATHHSVSSEADAAADDIDAAMPPTAPPIPHDHWAADEDAQLQPKPTTLPELQDTEIGAWLDASVSSDDASQQNQVSYNLSPSRPPPQPPFKDAAQFESQTECDETRLHDSFQTPPNSTPDPHEIYQLFPLDSPLRAEEAPPQDEDARTMSSSDPDPEAPLLDQAFLAPKHPATQALEAAQKSAEFSQKFIENCTPEDFANWALETVGPVFGGVTLNEGHTAGLSTGGGAGFLSKLTTAFGILARPIADLTGSSRQQINVARNARGLTLVVNNEKGHMWNLGLNAGPVIKIPKIPLITGITGTVSHGRKSTKVQGGVVMRSPRAGAVQHAQAIREFGEMLHTAVGWKKITNDDGQQTYQEPIDALLDKHANVSLGSVEHLNTSTYTTASGVSAFAGVVGPTGDALQSAGMAVGVGSKRQREKIDYAVTAGAQAYSTQQVTQSSAIGVVGSLGWRAAGEVGPHVQGVANDQLSNQMAGVTATMGLHTSSAKSNVSVIVWPDGSMIGERQLEFNNFEEFEALVTPHREAWLNTMMKKFEFPQAWTESDKRIRCERALNDFLIKSKQNMESGVLLLQEYLDVKPHVGAQLGGYKAQEELARRKVQQLQTNPQALTNAVAQAKQEAARAGQLYIDPITAVTAHVVALQAEQQKLLDDAASFQPFLLTSAGRSTKSIGKGLNFLVVAKKDTSIMAKLVQDRFPDINPNKVGYTKARAERNT
jgi:hypothetical protein